MQSENAQNNPVVEPEVPEENTENSQSSEITEPGASEVGATENTTLNEVDEAVDVLIVDPSPLTTYTTDGYEIDIIHSMTVGDILTSTLVTVLIIVVLLSRLLGGRS